MAAGALPAGEASTGLSSMLPTATPAPAPTVVEPLLDFAKDSGPNLAASPAAPLLGAIVPTVLFVVAALLFGSTRRKS
jgi:hypothetical protein